MSLNESIVEDAALEWFRRRQGYAGQVGELGHAVGHGAAFAGLRRAKPPLAPGEYAKGTLIPAFSQREKEEDREAIRRLNPAIACGNPHPTSPKGRGVEASACASHADRRATLRKFRIVHIERRMNP